jgi:hypothetical protein
MNHNRLTHLDEAGRARMVDVTDKLPTARMARAEASVWLGRSLANLLRRTGSVRKGNVLETARLAGIMGAKRPILFLAGTISARQPPLSQRVGRRGWHGIGEPPRLCCLPSSSPPGGAAIHPQKLRDVSFPHPEALRDDRLLNVASVLAWTQARGGDFGVAPDSCPSV